MAALSFTDDVDVSADTPLLPIFCSWVTNLSGNLSPATVRAYVSDSRMIAAALLEVLGRGNGTDRVAPAAYPRTPVGVSENVFRETLLLVSQLTLGDLHPENLAKAFANFGTSAPTRRRRTDGGSPLERRRDSTRRRAAAAWTTLCEYATAHGLLAANPMRDPRISRGGRPALNPTPLELGEADRLLQTLAVSDVARTSRHPWPARDLALASVLLTTGIRLAEVCTVSLGDLRDLDDAPHMHVLGKGSKHRTIPLSRATTVVLGAYLSERAERLGEPERGQVVFVQSDGRAFTPRALEHLVYRWYARADVVPQGESCVHALRHTFATQLVNSSASIVEVQELLGHESLNTTRRYLRSVGHGLRDAVEAHPATALVGAYAQDLAHT